MRPPHETIIRFIERNPLTGTLTFGFGVAAWAVLLVRVVLYCVRP